MRYGHRLLLPLTLTGILLGSGCNTADAGPDRQVLNPYSSVDWDDHVPIHSMTHYHAARGDWQHALPANRNLGQHGTGTRGHVQEAYDMGFRHLVFNNYYPAAPLHPIPEEWMRDYPDATFSPNAEHASYVDTGLHANSLGSLFRSGYGHQVDVSQVDGSPFLYTFDDVNDYDPDRPWTSVYRLDVRVEGPDDPEARVSIHGAELVDRQSLEPLPNGAVEGHDVACEDEACHTQFEQIWVRSSGQSIEVRLEYDDSVGEVAQFRLMQGTNRPWRQVMGAILDGEQPEEGDADGLLYPDGGGITLNHPGEPTADPYLEMLDFDERVLGMEVWNDRRWFGVEDEAPHDRYYRNWNDVLATGRRAWGFFSKDHRHYGRGRNVLLVPPLDGLDHEERERVLLRAYRQGEFFGLLGASHVDADGNVAAPYDHSDFRFTRIEVVPTGSSDGTLHVEVAGNDMDRRPQVAVRFMTEEGAEAIFHGPSGEFPLVREDGTRPVFVRVEAFALPTRHADERPISLEEMAAAHVYEIARLHDRVGHVHPNLVDEPGEEPIPIADMIFSQAIRIPR